MQQVLLGNRAVDSAYGTTVRDKFRPIFMGGLVGALGLLPASLAHGVGSQIQRPLAIVVVGGMSLGMTLILCLMPVLLRYVDAAPGADSEIT